MEEENVQEENRQDENLQETDHPIDVLATTLIDIQSQIKRLNNKNPHNLKSELLYNLYPIVLKGFAAILEYFEYLDAFNKEEDEDDDYEKMEKELNENLEKAIEMNKNLISLDSSISKKLKGKDKEKWDEIVSWVKSQTEEKGDKNVRPDADK